MKLFPIHTHRDFLDDSQGNSSAFPDMLARPNPDGKGWFLLGV